MLVSPVAIALPASSGASTPVNDRAGRVVAFGTNSKGELGDGTTTDRSIPTSTVGLDGVVALAAGGQGNFVHSLALRVDGTVWAWGGNQYGVLGDGTTTDHQTPVQVVGLDGITHVATGATHSVALRSDGSVWTWGDDYCGELGRQGDGRVPGQVPGLIGMRAVAAGGGGRFSGGHSLAVGADGKVYAWGANGSGQLGSGIVDAANAKDEFGLGCTRNQTPAAVLLPPGAAKAVAVAAGTAGIQTDTGFSLALLDDHSVYSWGENVYGELGRPNSAVSPLPLPVPGLLGKTVTALAAGNVHSLALTGDGTVYAWGSNTSGQMGTGLLEAPSVAPPGTFEPTAVTGLTDAAAIAAGDTFSLATRADGSLWAWGGIALAGSSGYRGQAGPTPSSVPTQIGGLAGPVSAVGAGETHSLAVVVAGTPPTTVPTTSTTVGVPVTLPPTTTPPTTTPSVTVTLPPTTTPVTIPLTTPPTTTAPGPRAGHPVVGFGFNRSGEIGDGTSIQRNYPATAVGLDNVVSVAASTGQSLALRADGTVWSWGRDARIPKPVAGLDNVVAVAAGGSFNLALRADGRVWAWGQNQCGELGTPNPDRNQPAPSRPPAQVKGALDGVKINSIAAGESYGVAVSDDGTVYSWGANTRGQLGRPLPDSVSTSVTVSLASCGVAPGRVVFPPGTAKIVTGAGTTWRSPPTGRSGPGGTTTTASSVSPTASTRRCRWRWRPLPESPR